MLLIGLRRPPAVSVVDTVWLALAAQKRNVTVAADELTSKDAGLDAVPASPSRPSRLVLRPPGAEASQLAVSRFSSLVDRTLSEGRDIEIHARGPSSVQAVLRSFALGKSYAADFEVTWANSDTDGREDASESLHQLRFVASRGQPWGDYMKTRFSETQSFFVQNDTKVLQLARAIATELHDKAAPALRVHAYVDDHAAVNVLAKSLATATHVRGHTSLRCVPNIVRPQKTRERMFVYVRPGPAVDVVSDARANVFTAIPPGKDADHEFVQRFTASVHDRLRRGDTVEMECRGPDAVAAAMRAFAELQGRTAEFEAEWKSGAQPPESKSPDKTVNFLKLTARLGQTWSEFNSTDFTESNRLLATSSSSVQSLSWAVVQEVRKRSAVAVHAYSDNNAAMNVAVKALATVPALTDGDRVRCVPSFGRTKTQKNPVLRLYVRHSPPPKRVTDSADS